MQDHPSLKDSRILVTGGAKGMAAAALRAFVADGARVVSLDIDSALGTQVAADATAKGPGRADFIACDVSEEAAVEAAVTQAIAILGGLDTLVHAAAVAPGSPAEDITVADWDRLFAINTRSTFLMNRAVFPHLKDKGGRILNFASSAGVQGLPNKAHYSATKGAVLAWSRTIAKEWGRYGITVNCVLPAIRTPMYELTRSRMTPDQLAAHDANLGAAVPIGGKLGDVERDFVPVIRFLASADAHFMTGQMFAIDGGAMMTR